MTMNVARLISPGVVTDRDAAQLSGAQDPMAYVMNLISGKSPDTAALLRNYDPFGPNFDVDGLVNVAKSVTTAEVPALLDQYSQANDRAIRSGMKQRQYRTIFGDNKNRDFLSDLLDKAPTEQPVKTPAKPQQAPPARTRTVQEVDAQDAAPKRLKFDSQGNLIQ